MVTGSKDKAPDVLNVVGDMLPDRGVWVWQRLPLENTTSIDPAEIKAQVDAEVKFQENVTER